MRGKVLLKILPNINNKNSRALISFVSVCQLYARSGRGKNLLITVNSMFVGLNHSRKWRVA